MAVQLKLKLFLLLTTLSFCCEAENSTVVKVVGLIHCTHDCGIRNHSSSSNASSNLGLDVLIICKGGKSNETKTQGNGGVDEHGKFNVTLSADPSSSIDGCYAKLQISNSSSSSSAPNCPIQASLNILHRPTTTIEFSPITCQSAFFWPFPNLTFFASPPPPPPPEYTPPPQPQVPLSPLASPVQPPQPSYDDPPSPPPTPPPTYQNLPTPTSSPQAPPPLPLYTEPSPPLLPPVNNPTPPKSPTPALSPPSLPPPSRRRPNPIPRAPPIPRLPVTPSVPRKYFNAPKSKSKPPRYD
ncbi:hypothetical protein C2S53_014017 [Perilla frutescens var. hirtella]|uniref:Uncharacterized protein n=1 Tax=Perilla frutescens var. hirtella TaxID=608512 RepID=A0AAD4IS38_PERFH|nr:hypothetical protein C2S53_014017 [Perilla frutescens var. hirtella]